MAIYRLGERVPSIDDSAFVADTAAVIGDVRLAADTSVWFGTVLRGDTEPIVIGEGTNVQDGAVLHTERDRPLRVAAHVTIGHQVVLHGCTIGDYSLIGIQAVVLDGAVIGRQCLVGAGAIVTAGTVVPDRSLVLGAPAKVVRELSEAELTRLRGNIEFYADQRRPQYLRELVRLDR
ncbi:gamma carbonic anhydrase family protein [Burkholderia gladioli]|uniref:gamma carbonic anhydrase family protein n=1 Tax=Burkholderia gladioli TaxID=28095 RepID=UPI001917231D|nr:gamma carbonic anhydrase family protein [Burkholderia gladioli]